MDVYMQNLQKQLSRTQKVLEISQHLTSTMSIDKLLKQIVEAAVEVTESASAGLLLLAADGAELRFVIASDSAGQITDIPVPIEGSIAGYAFRSGEPLIVPDVRADPRYYAQVEKEVGLPVESLLAVPLQFKSNPIGVLEVQNKGQGEVYNQLDVDILAALAVHATVAIENARLYDEVLEHRNQLEDLVAQRTIELQQAVSEAHALNEQLSQEVAQREILIRDLKGFSHMVAHDLKTPLNAILGYTRLMLDVLEDEPNEQLLIYLKPIQQTSYHMDRIINELLTLAQVRQQQITPHPLNMAQVLDVLTERLALLIQEYQAEITLPQRWPMSVGYSPWVTEVWANYLSNAIKYGGTPPLIACGADIIPPTDNGTAMARFWVQDNGPGIPREKQTQLFTAFTQLDTHRATGHGLGLSIVKQIVEKLGGTVGVESEPGAGSRFYFTLPLAQG
jgi:signal transduction histidine kinase